MSVLPKVTIRHWLPIVTFCPVNGLPDFLYVSIKFQGFVELYAVRKKIRKIISLRKMFMETVAEELMKEFPDAIDVQVRLAFDRHVVSITRRVR